MFFEIFCAFRVCFCSSSVLLVVDVFRLKVPRTTALFESRLAAREETTAVREEHFENCSSLRLPLQKLFDVLMF